MPLKCDPRKRLPKIFDANAYAAIALIAALFAVFASASAAEFSADLLRRDAHGQVLKGHLSVAGGKVRIEQPNLPTGFFIVRGTAKAAYFVKPDREVFMDALQSSILTELLSPVDPQAPCITWQMRARLSGSASDGGAWHCERLGTETRNDRSTLKYGLISPGGKHFSGWIDTQLRFLVRIESASGITLELVDVREARQPDSQFEFPPGYSMFDPQQLIEQMKHSDSYIDPSMDSRAKPLQPRSGPDL
jgi:hypothetical protein